MQEWAAWYSGDTERLADYYRYVCGYSNTTKGRFWGKTYDDENRPLLHVPIAGDIAGVSADLLFSEEPTIEITEASDGNSEAQRAQERLDEIIEQSGFISTMISAAEISAALGGCYLKVDWDNDWYSVPIVTICQPDVAFPTFGIAGDLRSISFVREVERTQSKVWRHIEYREAGLIENALFEGSDTSLGRRMPLNSHESTLGLQDVVATRIDDVLVRYIPNRIPNRLFRGSPFGMSDYAGQEPLMDALDETFSLWIDDIRRARGRIIVPEQWLEKDDRSGKFMFNEDRTVFVRLPNMGPPGEEGSPLTVQQFAIRAQEHQQTAIELLDRIITSSGYSPQSFGLSIEGRAESGTALRIRERKSLKTQQKKAAHFKPRVEDILYLALQVDRLYLNSDTPIVYRPHITFADSIQESMDELSKAVLTINQAEAASIQTKVEMLHPEWGYDQVQAEVKRIMDESGRTVTEPDFREF
jgi:A118 family predicted phage portal protein